MIDDQQGRLIYAYQDLAELKDLVTDLHNKLVTGNVRIKSVEEELEWLCKFVRKYKALSEPQVSFHFLFLSVTVL